MENLSTSKKSHIHFESYIRFFIFTTELWHKKSVFLNIKKHPYGRYGNEKKCQILRFELGEVSKNCENFWIFLKKIVFSITRACNFFEKNRQKNMKFLNFSSYLGGAQKPPFFFRRIAYKKSQKKDKNKCFLLIEEKPPFWPPPK